MKSTLAFLLASLLASGVALEGNDGVEEAPYKTVRRKRNTRRRLEECADSADWWKSGEPSKDCSWVAAFKTNRCGLGRGDIGARSADGTGALYACPVTCGMCDVLNEETEDDNIDTDYYLAATPESVTWGYYDLEKEPLLTMASGETITVEVITHHSGHEYAKMIRGDPAVEDVFYWAKGTALEDKPVPKLPNSGVHIITGPIEIEGAMPGDILQVEILSLDPRPHPVTGKTYGTNSQKFAGYQFRVGYDDGSEYTRDGGNEAITVFEFEKTPSGKMAWGKPVYMYTFPTLEDAGGNFRTIDNMPCVVIPHDYNYGENLELIEDEPVEYPEGFNGTTIISDGINASGVINYLELDLDWKSPLRPHLGLMGVMPADSGNYVETIEGGGANSIPPAQFGGNVDDWRIGKGATMYYKVELEGGMLVVGDTHAAQGDSELAGTAMETSMTAQLRVTLHKSDSLPKLVETVDYPLLETDEQYVIHGFAYAEYLSQLETPSSIFAEGASIDLALEDCFNKTRSFLINAYDMTEQESIAFMSTAVDFAITQIVDGNWGVHSSVPKWSLDEPDGEWTGYDYKCTPNPGGFSRRLSLSKEETYEHKLASLDFDAASQSRFFKRVTRASADKSEHHAKLQDKLVHVRALAMDQYHNPTNYQNTLVKKLVEAGILVPDPKL